MKNKKSAKMSVNRGVNGFVMAVVAMLFLVTTTSVRAVERQVLHGHVPAAVAHLQPLGRYATNRMHLTIGLPLRNQEALDELLRQIYDPASPNYRHYLTPEQFTEKFGPTEDDYEAVVAFAQANGLMVTGRHPNRTLLDVSGLVPDIEKAFHVTLRVYQHPTEARTFYAPDTEPSLDLTAPILHISGLDNYVVPRPHLGPNRLNNVSSVTPNIASGTTGSGPYGSYIGNDFRAAYAPGVALDGSGQIVGLVEGVDYDTNEIAYYANLAKLPRVPSISDAGGLPATCTSATIESCMDIELVISMAPGLSEVILYNDSESGLNNIVTDDLANQISSSWDIAVTRSVDQIFQQMAAQGQSFFMASGDGDAGGLSWGGDDPYITEVGGTTLTTAGPGGAWVSEKVWNWGTTLGGYTGSGGGVSGYYSIPSYQTNIDMTANGGSTTMRNVPDVALTADNVYARAGCDYVGGGTSAAAPLWAGFMALVNQKAATSGFHSVGFINPAIYAIGQGPNYTSCFHDIVTGDNTSPGSPTEYYAVPGYDLCTGWGTPNGQSLIDALAGQFHGTPPVILTQPQSANIAVGDSRSVIFSVTAMGTPTLRYQWLFNGAKINGQTNTTLTLSNIQTNNAGDYSVAITNVWGSTTSAPAILQVLPPPYVVLSGSLTNFTFQGDETYYINGPVNLYGTIIFEGGAVIKYARSANLFLYTSNVQTPTAACRPVFFTAADDNSVGKAIIGSVGYPSGYYAGGAFISCGLTYTMSNIRVSYANTAFVIQHGGVTISDAQIGDCQNGLVLVNSGANLRNALFWSNQTNLYLATPG